MQATSYLPLRARATAARLGGEEHDPKGTGAPVSERWCHSCSPWQQLQPPFCWLCKLDCNACTARTGRPTRWLLYKRGSSVSLCRTLGRPWWVALPPPAEASPFRAHMTLRFFL